MTSKNHFPVISSGSEGVKAKSQKIRKNNTISNFHCMCLHKISPVCPQQSLVASERDSHRHTQRHTLHRLQKNQSKQKIMLKCKCKAYKSITLG